MATKTTKGCPKGQVSNGKGGCKPALPPKPSPKVSAETVEEKAERIAKAKEAAAAAEQKRVAGLSKKEFRQEKQGIKRNVKVADLKAGKEGKGGKVATAILGALSSAVGVAEGVKGLLKKEKKGGAINNKLKTIGNMKTTRTKMKMGGAKKYGPGGPTSQSKPTRPKDQPQPLKKATAVTTDGAKASKMPTLKNGGGPKKINTAGGIPITARAADRKVSKGKGMMTYKYGTTDAPGTGNNKGAYVKFAKDQESNPYGGKSLKGSRSRSVMKKGGATKKK
jgi:hypothetical protein